MEPNSTQAVKADTTAQENPVKRLRRGDVREDGMVFWGYHPGCANGEWWIKPTHFFDKQSKAKKRKADALVNRKLARAHKGGPRIGSAREDGMVFLGYHSGCAGGEWWTTLETAKTRQQRSDARAKKKEADETAGKTLRCGDTREDGMVFWKYKLSCKDGQNWILPEVFERRRKRTSERKRERIATDPLYALKHRLRSRVYSALKSKGFRKNTKTAIMLGCTYEEFRAHIERLFLPGMSWTNFSDGHLDHIVPLDAAVTEEDVYSLNHFTNLRPMWGGENQSKSSKLPEEHELPDSLHSKVKEIYLTAKARSA